MLVYEDIFSGDELLSDAYPHTFSDDGVLIQAEGSIREFEGTDLLTTPEQIEDAQANGACEYKMDISTQMELQKMELDKKGFQGYIKRYMKQTMAKLETTKPERVEIFKKGAIEFINKVLKDFKSFEFYLGQSCDLEGGMVFVEWYADNDCHVFCFLDGLKAVKC